MHAAIAAGHWDVAELLLKECAGALLEQTDSRGRTPTMIAAMEGHTAMLELLVARQVFIFKLISFLYTQALSLTQ